MSEVYLVHGFRFECDVELPAPRAGGPPDVRVSLDEPRPVPQESPPGEILASLDEEGVAYTTTDDEGTLRARIPGFAEFEVDPDRRRARLHLDPAVEPGLGPILICGALPSLLLAEAGVCVLHASAVEVAGRAIAFVGGSGGGKSTLAAVMCGAGATLITDDLLRVQADGGGVRAAAGLPEIRLREPAAPLAAGVPGESSSTADGRTAVRVAETVEAPLAAIVIPLPDRSATAVQVDRLTETEALVELARYPRSSGWRRKDVRAARFSALAHVARTVPVFRVRIPWGPPFAVGLAAELAGLAGVEDLR